MNQNERYLSAKEMYAKIGVDTEAALAKLQNIRISMHCWQADDVHGFEGMGALTGGIQTTGNYPGIARNPEEVFADLDKALSLIPGTHKINVHANYAIGEPGETIERDKLEPRHFAKWVELAKKHGCGLDFNPTIFSHPMAKDGMTLSHPDKEVRDYWVRHTIACIRISEYFATETGYPCVMNIWTGDGTKDIPADRMGPRARYADSIDRALACGYDKSKVYVTVESKVFGIGVEAYTVGSGEFSLCYAISRGITPLMDNGHYHPTEVVSDKIPALLAFFPEIALHITRPIRWDSDHVVLLDDETKEICKEILRCGGLEGKVYMALDYFDASINRISAWVVGIRNAQKALLMAALTPDLTEMQNAGNWTELMVVQEEVKTLPFGDVWAEYCARQGAPADGEWFATVKAYENDVLAKRV